MFKKTLLIGTFALLIIYGCAGGSRTVATNIQNEEWPPKWALDQTSIEQSDPNNVYAAGSAESYATSISMAKNAAFNDAVKTLAQRANADVVAAFETSEVAGKTRKINGEMDKESEEIAKSAISARSVGSFSGLTQKDMRYQKRQLTENGEVTTVYDVWVLAVISKDNFNKFKLDSLEQAKALAITQKNPEAAKFLDDLKAEQKDKLAATTAPAATTAAPATAN
jgi:hypothetical protein